MVKEAVEQCGGDGGVAVEDGSPVLEGIIGGQDDEAAFIALADDLEEEVRAALVDGQAADSSTDVIPRGAGPKPSGPRSMARERWSWFRQRCRRANP